VWSAGSRLQIGLAARWARTIGTGDVLACDGGGIGEVLDALDQLERPARRIGSVEFTLSGGLVRPFMFDVPDGLRSVNEVHAVASGMALDATGHAQECTVWLHRWRPGASCLACAIETRVVDRLVAWAKARGCPMRGLRPWWMHAINEALRLPAPPPLVVLHDDDTSLFFAGLDGEPTMAMACCPPPAPAPLAAMLGRMSLGQGAQTVAAMQGRWRASAGMGEAGAGDRRGVAWHSGGPP
jgi:hypothetical protein